MSTRIMNTKTMSDEEIQELFEVAFENQVAKWNNIDNFEVKCTREVGKDSIAIEINVMGTAGCPTAEDFKQLKVKNASTVRIERADKGELTLKLQQSKTLYLNSTEYIIIYQS